MTDSADSFSFKPLAVFHCDARYSYELPRQGRLADVEGRLVFRPGLNLDQMLTDLDGFSHLWLLFHFHQADAWKPLVSPPRAPGGRKVGVLASRSPHRPNPIGLSCVELLSIEANDLHVRGADLVDGSPVLDIKPYLSYCDAIPDASPGWTAEQSGTEFRVEFTAEVESRAVWIFERSGLNLLNVARFQLDYEPDNAERKRVSKEGDHFVFACRTWRLIFRMDHNHGCVFVSDLKSGYREEELMEGAPDPYSDKCLHRAFRETFA